jgi:hypothetical protein
MKTSLDLLNNISVALPCSADWDEMTGDHQVRFCGHCEKNVYNLSALTTEQAISLIREKEGRLCTRFFRREDGTMLTADCPVGIHHRIRRKRRLATFAASLAGLLGFGGCTKFDDGPGASTANPPAKQEQSSQTDPNEKELKEGNCIMGKLDFRDLPTPETPLAGEARDSLPPPREVKVD